MTGGRWATVIIVVALLGLFVWAFWMKTVQEAKEIEALDEYELTPSEFYLLPENKKQHYRERRLEVPLPQDWGGALFSTSAGAWGDVYEKAVHTGSLDPLMAQYNRAVFEMAHPRIRIRFQPWDMWSADYRSQTLVAVQSGRAPAVSVAI